MLIAEAIKGHSTNEVLAALLLRSTARMCSEQQNTDGETLPEIRNIHANKAGFFSDVGGVLEDAIADINQIEKDRGFK